MPLRSYIYCTCWLCCSSYAGEKASSDTVIVAVELLIGPFAIVLIAVPLGCLLCIETARHDSVTHVLAHSRPRDKRAVATT